MKHFIKHKGFTLSEMIISVAIMSLVIVSVLSVYFNGITAIKKGKDSSNCVSLAESKISQAKLLFIKYRKFNYDISTKITGTITGNNITISPSPAIIWKGDPNAPEPMTPLTIEGLEECNTCQNYKFKIAIEDYNGPANNYEIKLVTVLISRNNPPMEYKVNSLICLNL
jgi:prepilin-type N-terminal cleavage/methylation domain-containing protein